jgi:hypothetical protein
MEISSTMKSIFPILAAVVMCTACDDDSSDTHLLQFDIHSSFVNDTVKIIVDNHEMMNQSVTTDPALGADLNAKAIANLLPGQHNLEIYVHGDGVGGGLLKKISLESDLYVGIKFYRDKNRVALVYSPKPFVY